MKKYENDCSDNFQAEVEEIRFCQKLLSKTSLVILNRLYWIFVLNTAIFSSPESTQGSVEACSRLCPALAEPDEFPNCVDGFWIKAGNVHLILNQANKE